MRKLPNDLLDDPVRRCILNGERAPRAVLIRLVLGPDDVVHVDARACAPGRGAWIGATRDELGQALARGRLGTALSRAFKRNVGVPEALPEAIDSALRRALLDRLGLEARAGALIAGFDKIDGATRRGEVSLLLHAADAAADGCRKLDQALRVGLDAEGSDIGGVILPLDRESLSMALGKENAVHLGLVRRDAAIRVADLLRRHLHFLGEDVTILAGLADTSVPKKAAAC